MVPVSQVCRGWRDIVIAEGNLALQRNFIKFLEQLIAAIVSIAPDSSGISGLKRLLTMPAPAKTEYDASDRHTTNSLFLLLRWQKRQARSKLRHMFNSATLTEKLHPLIAVEGRKFFLTRLAADETIENSRGGYYPRASPEAALEICLAVDDIGKAKECIFKMEHDLPARKTLCFYHVKHKQPEQALEVLRNLQKSCQGSSDFADFFLLPLLRDIESIAELSFLRLLHMESLPSFCIQHVRVSLCRLELKHDQPENARALVKLICEDRNDGSNKSAISECEEAFVQWCLTKEDWKQALEGISGSKAKPLVRLRVQKVVEECSRTKPSPALIRELLKQPEIIVDTKHKARLLGALVGSLPRNEQIDAAVETVRRMPTKEPFDPQRNLCEIIELLIKKGYHERAASLLSEVVAKKTQLELYAKVEPHILLM